jgi:putative ABC transport system permease protein
MFSVSPGNFSSWREEATVFEEIAAYQSRSFNLTGGTDPERLRGATVSAGLFAMLGSPPALGRDFLPEEDQPGRDGVVIVSHGFWQRRFGGSSDLIGKSLTLDTRSYTVIGIMPSGFEFPRPETELWMPIAFAAEQRDQHGSHYLRVAARLKDGVDLERARVDLGAIAQRPGGRPLASRSPALDRERHLGHRGRRCRIAARGLGGEAFTGACPRFAAH